MIAVHPVKSTLEDELQGIPISSMDDLSILERISDLFQQLLCLHCLHGVALDGSNQEDALLFAELESLFVVASDDELDFVHTDF